MRLHLIDLEMNFQTKKQGMNVQVGYVEHHLQFHCCALSAELLQSRDPKSPPTQEMVAIQISFYYGIARLCEHPILSNTGTSILDLRILDSSPPLRIHLDPYASPPAWSQIGQICGSLLQIMYPSLEYPDKGWKISSAPFRPIQNFYLDKATARYICRVT